MKKQVLLIILTALLSFNCFAQISFEKGYYIDNTGTKIDCFIKNVDRRNNPTGFQYKLTENSDQKSLTISSVMAFEIYNVSKYVRYTVNMDRSNNRIGEISTIKDPVFNQETLFLKVLIEGSADLFQYIDGSLRRYFFKTNSSDIEQLIYKKFKSKAGKIFNNSEYKQQLWSSMNCDGFSINMVEGIDYNKTDLVKFFIKYNTCKKSNFTNLDNSQKKDLFNLSLRPGLRNSSLEIEDLNDDIRSVDFGSKSGIRLGLELEFILPSNKNKWSIIVEPTYQTFKSEKIITGIVTFPATIPFDRTVKVEYTSIEIPLGVRHYMFLNKNSKLFINGSVLFDLNLNSIVDFEQFQDLDIGSNNSLVFGIGYSYNKYSLEFRVATDRDLLSKNSAWSSNYTSFGIIAGYSIF